MRSALIAVALALNATGATHSQSLVEIGGAVGSDAGGATTIAVHQSWTVRCDTDAGATVCRMSTEALGANASGSKIAVTLSGEAAKSGDPLFYFRVPLDLLVANGAEMRLAGGSTLRLAYRSCHAAGCLIPFRLTKELAARFRKDASVALRLFDLETKPIDIEISLAGFSAALKGMVNVRF